MLISFCACNKSQYAQLVALQDKKKGEQRPKSRANVKDGGEKRAEGGARSQRLDSATDSASGLQATTAKTSAGGLSPHPVDAYSDEGIPFCVHSYCRTKELHFAVSFGAELATINYLGTSNRFRMASSCSNIDDGECYQIPYVIGFR